MNVLTIDHIALHFQTFLSFVLAKQYLLERELTSYVPKLNKGFD